MIRVFPKDEPSNFEENVRKKGRAFLKESPSPSTKEINRHHYWRNALRELHDAYDGVCAYSCHFIPYDTGADTVEHFVPKTEDVEKIYEWNNFRLVCSRLNGRKSNYQDVIDPFAIEDGWFIMEFPSLFIFPNQDLGVDIQDRITASIKRVKLNDQATCVRQRLSYIKSFCEGDVSFKYLEKEAPFIAKELHRQSLVENIPEIMGFP